MSSADSTLTTQDILNMLGGNLPTAPTYTPASSVPALSGTSTLDQQLVSLLGSQGALPNANLMAELSALIPGIASNPYAGTAQQAANTAGASSGQLGAQDVATALGLLASSTAPSSALSSLLTTAFDPQSALYSQSLQQLQDAVNANLANQGLLNSPAGQGVLDQALSNFNINWQNNLLNRMTQGLGAYTSGVAGMGNAATQAANLGNTGVQAQATAGSLPYGTANTTTNNALSQLLQLLSGNNATTSTLGNLLSGYQTTANQRGAVNSQIGATNYQNQNSAFQQAVSMLAAAMANGGATPTGTGIASTTGVTPMPTAPAAQLPTGTAVGDLAGFTPQQASALSNIFGGAGTTNIESPTLGAIPGDTSSLPDLSGQSLGPTSSLPPSTLDTSSWGPLTQTFGTGLPASGGGDGSDSVSLD